MSSKVERKLAAIMFTDIVGYTKIIGNDESTGLSILENQESLISPLVSKYHGKIINTTGDGYLIEFSSSVESVECAIEMQEEIKKYNENKNNLEFHIRIGIHLGDIVVIDNNILGEGVNIASRIEPMANPDGICMTEVVYQSVKSKLDISPKRISNVDLKHIDDKYTLYKIPDVSKTEPSDDDTNQIQNNFNIAIENVVKEPMNFTRFVMIFFSFICFISLFSIISTSLLGLVDYFFPSANLLDYGNDHSRSLSKYFYNKYFNPTDIQLFTHTLVTIMLLIATNASIKRRFIITFKDIRNVNQLANILILQMGYKYIENKNGQIKYFYPMKEKSFFRRIFTLSFIPYIYKQRNTLLLKYDGNTITIECRHLSLKRFIQRLF